MFDLVRLRLLREFAHRGTMTAVAEACGMTSSAVSQQLATLEREARAVLLEHVGRRVRLTAEGQRLVAHAEIILQAVETAALDLRAADERPKGELEIACFSTFAKSRLLPALVRARERCPGLRLVVRELESPDAIEAVRDGRCHIAVTFAYNLVPHPEVAGLSSRLLLDEPVVLALPRAWAERRGAAARDPIDLADLAEEDWIVGSRQSDDCLLAERACALAGFVPRIAHTIDDYDLLLRMVAAGLGVGFVPELGLRFSNTQDIVIRRPAGVSLSRRVHALTRAALADSPTVRALMAELTVGSEGSVALV